MWAFVYVKHLKKYFTIEGSKIESFTYEKQGYQSKKFSSKPFHCTIDETPQVCQVLIVAGRLTFLLSIQWLMENFGKYLYLYHVLIDTKKEVLSLQKGHRVPVPKLNSSDLDMTQSSQLSKQQKEKVDRKLLKQKKEKGIINNNEQIIAKHVSALISGTDSAVKESTIAKNINDPDTIDSDNSENGSEDESTQAINTKQNNNLPDLSDTDEVDDESNSRQRKEEIPATVPTPTDAFEENPGASAIFDEVPAATTTHARTNNEQMTKLQQENEILKSKCRKQESAARKALDVAKVLQDKYNKLKQHVAERQPMQENCVHTNNEPSNPLNESSGSRKCCNTQNQKKVEPEPLNTNSGIYARADAVDAAYSKIKPSVFYEHMCYAVWGHKELSLRCVKHTKRTQHLKVLTPKKRRVIKKHFVHFLSHWEYPDMLFKVHLSEINSYAHRAIVNAKKHMKLIENYPVVAEMSDDENDANKIEL